jgi:rhodanese-related sulfurtransferase
VGLQDKIKQELVIIDVRRQDEYQQYGIIPNAHKLMTTRSPGLSQTLSCHMLMECCVFKIK